MSYTDPSTLTWGTEEVPSSAKMNSATNDQFLALLPDGVTSDAWSPTLVGAGGNPGVSSTTGRAYRFGPIQLAWVTFVLSSGGGGQYRVALPAASANVSHSTSEGKGQRVGGFTLRDHSTGQVVEGSVNLYDASTVWFVLSDAITINGIITHNNPFAVGADDVLTVELCYPVA